MQVSLAEQDRQRSDTVAFLRCATADDADFVALLRARDRAAVKAMFDRHVDRVERVLYRVLGADPEIPDLVQDVFVSAISGIAGYRGDEKQLATWLTQIAVRSARKCIRTRTTRRVLGLTYVAELREPRAVSDPAMEATLGRAYAILAKLPARERIPFALRYIEGMRLAEVADACNTSLATAKRRLVRARDRFERLAARDSVLRDWLEEARR